jgi:hypothetical protein
VRSPRRYRGLLLTVALFALTVPTSGQRKAGKAAAPRPAPAPAETRVKVAEGKYELLDKGATPERSFVETWELFKTRLGYELVEQWHVGAGASSPANIIDVAMDLASGLHTVRIRIGTQEDRSLICTLALSEFHCRSQGTEARVPMSGVYDFFSPSPWNLGSIVRRARKDPREATSVQLVRMAGMSPRGPRLASFTGEVQYLGDDQIEVGGRRVAAAIYEVRAPGMAPTMMVWVDADGIVLALQDAARQDQRMELTEYRKLARF